MRLAFLGTPEAAVPTLRALVDAGHDVVIVITRPDRKRGRGAQLTASPVKECAHELGLTVTDQLGDLANVNVERGVVVAYGRLIPAEALARTPMLNVHFSLLPRWRGAAPLERAILAGDVETGISVMTLEADLDTGPVHLERRVAIGDKSLAALRTELAMLGAQSLVEVLATPELLEHPTPQRGDATYAKKMAKEEFHLEPTMSTSRLVRTVRLGRAFTTVHGRRLLIESAQFDAGLNDEQSAPTGPPGSITLRDQAILFVTSDGTISVGRVRPEGGRSMDAVSWWVGARLDDRSARWT